MSPRRPEWITFTGLDDYADLTEVILLSKQYPVEWGVLFSPTRQCRDLRYPGSLITGDVLEGLAAQGVKLSAHLCGNYARAIHMYGSTVQIPLNLTPFKRVQVNGHELNTGNVCDFAFKHNLKAIQQWRGSQFPISAVVSWLFDRSGGRGIRVRKFPKHPGESLVGYAGGLAADNITEAITQINAPGPYWMDMEGRVRTEGNRLDLTACRAVCEAVYGPPQ